MVTSPPSRTTASESLGSSSDRSPWLGPTVDSDDGDRTDRVSDRSGPGSPPKSLTRPLHLSLTFHSSPDRSLRFSYPLVRFTPNSWVVLGVRPLFPNQKKKSSRPNLRSKHPPLSRGVPQERRDTTTRGASESRGKSVTT